MTKLIRPLPEVYKISSDIGIRFHPLQKRNKMHNGVDIAAPEGTNIRAAGDGKVIWCGDNGNTKYGNTVVVEHSDGKLSLYAHMKDINVKSGDIVRTGDSIGTVGHTGASSGNHLHYEVIDGNRFDNGIKIKDKIKWADSNKEAIAGRKVLGIGPQVPREDPKNNFNKRYYIWHTCGDNKVRSSHAELDGTIHSTDEEIFPGEEYGCRCWAEEVGDENVNE